MPNAMELSCHCPGHGHLRHDREGPDQLPLVHISTPNANHRVESGMKDVDDTLDRLRDLAMTVLS